MEVGIIPIRTHLITEQDDIVDVVWQYTHRLTGPEDLIAVAETVVAITQERAVLPRNVRPGLLARYLCAFPGRAGSLTSPYSMQLAIDEAGRPRILLAVVAAAVGRLLGRKGDFFRVAGPHVAWIDDVAGTMFPYHRYIVLGPKNPNRVARRIKERTGVETVIVDANDLRRVDVIGASPSIDRSRIVELLLNNPFGNWEQQTPITILKNFFNVYDMRRQ